MWVAVPCWQIIALSLARPLAAARSSSLDVTLPNTSDVVEPSRRAAERLVYHKSNQLHVVVLQYKPSLCSQTARNWRRRSLQLQRFASYTTCYHCCLESTVRAWFVSKNFYASFITTTITELETISASQKLSVNAALYMVCCAPIQIWRFAGPHIAPSSGSLSYYLYTPDKCKKRSL